MVAAVAICGLVMLYSFYSKRPGLHYDIDMHARRTALLLAALLIVGASAPSTEELRPPNIPKHVGSWGVELSDRDLNVKPGDDFFMFENGTWFARAEILPQAPGAAYWRDLRILAPYYVRDAIDALEAAPNPNDGIETKAVAFYRAYMEMDSIERLGIEPLRPELERVRLATTRSKMAALMGRVEGPESQRDPVLIQPIGRGLFTLNILQDQRDPSRYAVYVGQGGLQLLGPEYYLDPKLSDIKTAYEAYVAKMLTYVGWQSPREYARKIVEFETRVAAVSWTRAQMLDRVKTYNPISVSDLSSLAPDFDWRAYLDGAGLANVRRVVIDAKPAFPAIAGVFAQTPIDVLQARQAFSAADSGAPRLNAAMVEANYDFRTKILSGQSIVNNPRWIRAIREMQVDMNDVVTKLYIDRTFSPESKQMAVAITDNLVKAFDSRLAHSTWLSPQTIARARDKLAKMSFEIGYPKHLRTYENLEIRNDDLYGNVKRATAYKWNDNVGRLNAPFDRREWTIAPIVAGYNYVPSTNTVEVPAASLQPPFFDPQADPAVNYGAIGALIAGTIINGFDDQGRRFDGEGRLTDWWTAKDSENFAVRMAKLRDQYSAMEPLPGIHVKGELVASQAMADIGGLETALDAYHLSLRGTPPPVLDGLTGNQRLFLGWAQLWRAKMRPAFVRMLLATGANAPPALRVNGTVDNVDAWYEAFNVKAGDKIFVAPQDRAHIW